MLTSKTVILDKALCHCILAERKYVDMFSAIHVNHVHTLQREAV